MGGCIIFMSCVCVYKFVLFIRPALRHQAARAKATPPFGVENHAFGNTEMQKKLWCNRL